MGDTQTQFKTVSDAVRYLLSRGWQLSEKSLYRHISHGKIKDKPWSHEDLDAYAGEHLRPSSATPAAQPAARLAKGAAAEILAARKEKIQVDTDLKKLELQVNRGKYMLIEEHIRKSCNNMRVIKDAVHNWIYESAGDLIASVGGDPVRQYEFIAKYHEDLSRYLSRLDTDLPIKLSFEDMIQ